MSLPGIRELELEAGEALQALRGMPAEPLSTRIDREIDSHLSEDGRPESKLPDSIEIKYYNEIWRPLEFLLDRECVYTSGNHARPIIVTDFQHGTETIIHHAQHQNWTEMIQHIKWLHSIVQPFAHCKWQLPLIQDGLQVPPTMEEAVWMTIALCQQLVFTAAATTSDTLKDLALRADARFKKVVAHLLRRRPSESGNMRIMSPAQFFEAAIFDNRPGFVALRHHHHHHHHNNNNNNNDNHHHQSIISSPAIAPIHETPNISPLVDNGPRPLPDMSQSIEEEHPSDSDWITVTDTDVDSPSDHGTRSPTITQEQPAPPAQVLNMPAAPTGTDPLGQRGQPVLEKTADELRRARQWLHPSMGMPAPEPCKRCAKPKTQDHDKCWIPRPQYQAKHGLTCAYCRIQKSKCSFSHPDSDKEEPASPLGNSASVQPATAGTLAAGASTAVSNNEEEQEGDGDDQQYSQEQEHSQEQDGPREDSQQ